MFQDIFNESLILEHEVEKSLFQSLESLLTYNSSKRAKNKVAVFTLIKGGGAYEVINYRNTIHFIANYHFTITSCRLCDMSEIPNTMQNLLKLPFHSPKNYHIP